ncbi:hypothetical protein HF669_09210 [Acidithiobacillus thiooxidans]|uniref:hypothetical protein n=1 Tax=Acidithiobacillus thiooxidans TaxID=930 RepID=UPI0002DD0526|nr:hypothetical protein [Acidithiobacillus thiooxidans]MBU2811539.1 hypothetical protein [Acidithiobacillus thiooxidans]
MKHRTARIAPAQSVQAVTAAILPAVGSTERKTEQELLNEYGPDNRTFGRSRCAGLSG